MHKLFLSLLFLAVPTVVQAQESYTKMTRTALETMWKYQGNKEKGFDTLGYRSALSMYEAAFQRFPDSIGYLGLYKSSVLAGELGLRDTAFMHLASIMEMFDADVISWRLLTGPYVTSEYKNLLGDSRWDNLVREATERKKIFYDKLAENERELLANQPFSTNSGASANTLYRQIRDFNEYLPKSGSNFSVSLPINDSTATSYFVHLPPHYDPQQKHPVLFFLHGTVRHNSLAEYQTTAVLGDWNRFYLKYADSMGVVLVFPKGSRQYNWMTSDDGFFMVPAIVRQLKKSLNINDDKVFVSGHSNGATGSFSYLVKQATPFAGFYGFNTYPKVFTGGTFAENARNRSFKNFSTDQDYYYPPAANDSLSALMSRLKVDYQDVRFNGFPHWFPEFDASEEAYVLLFDDLLQRTRNPFPKELSWEFDDNNYGSVDWLSNLKLDTLAEAADWHQPVNFPIDHWLEYDDQDSLITFDVDREAFDLPRKSGKVHARYENNVFTVNTSRISSFTILISPEMVDLDRPVRVIVNGELKFDGRVNYDNEVMLAAFKRTWDREQVWVDHIFIEL